MQVQHQQIIAYAMQTKMRSVLTLKYAVPVSVVLAIFFIAFSDVDLWVSGLFFRPKIAEYSVNVSGFWLSESSFLQFIYLAVDVVSRLALLGSVGVFIWYLANKNAKAFFAAVVIVCFIMGPLLAVNAGFKEHWGRARPRDILQFEGVLKFTPAWIISNQCEHNCAFTSGHAAAGFSLCIGFLISRRSIWLKAGFILGSFIGLTRIMNGAHFLSDVIFSFFIVLITTAVTAWVTSTLTLKYLNKDKV